ILSRYRDQYSDFHELVLCDDEIVDEYCQKNNFDTNYVPTRPSAPKTEKQYDFPLSFLDDKNVGECPYFLNRGFSRQILEKHGVYECRDQTKPLYGWNIVPIF